MSQLGHKITVELVRVESGLNCCDACVFKGNHNCPSDPDGKLYCYDFGDSGLAWSVHSQGRPSRKCKHRKTWIISGGLTEWCHDCGAFRNLAPASLRSNAIRPISSWCLVGMSYDDFIKKDLAWRKRYLSKSLQTPP